MTEGIICSFKDPPRVISAGPDRLVTAPLFTAANFECVAEGNPTPTYKWVQRFVNKNLALNFFFKIFTFFLLTEFHLRATFGLNVDVNRVY